MANLTYKPGDWQCRKCGRHNFASRYWCRWIECGANRHGAQGQIQPIDELARQAFDSAASKREREDPPPLECPDPMYESLAKRVKVLEDAVLKLVRLNRKRDEEDEHRNYQLNQRLTESEQQCKLLQSQIWSHDTDIKYLYDRVSDLEDSSSSDN